MIKKILALDFEIKFLQNQILEQNFLEPDFEMRFLFNKFTGTRFLETCFKLKKLKYGIFKISFWNKIS